MILASVAAWLFALNPEDAVYRDSKELKAFRKLKLKPGEQKRVVFTLGKDAFSFYDSQKGDWIAEAGEFQILVGRSSRDIRLRKSLRYGAAPHLLKK